MGVIAHEFVLGKAVCIVAAEAELPDVKFAPGGQLPGPQRMAAGTVHQVTTAAGPGRRRAFL